jgi:hypothetical protein
MTFFDPIVIDGMEYRDGGLMYNNPVDQAHAEASEVFPNRTQIVVSLGTGLVTTKAFSPNLATVAQELGKIATETERVHDSFYRRDGSRAARSGRYYRFNVPEIGDKGLAESKQEDLTFLRKKTERYIDNPETGSKLASCTEQLAEGAFSMISSNSGLPEDLLNRSPAASTSLSLEDRMEKLRR